MRRYGHVPLGIFLGLLVALGVSPLLESLGGSSRNGSSGDGGAEAGGASRREGVIDRILARSCGAILSECDGRIQDLVIHYASEGAGVVATAYRDFLAALPADVAVHAVCPKPSDLDDLLLRVGPTRCRISAVIVGHPITSWARDRWLALEPAAPGGPIALLSPAEEAGAAVWPARAGDHRVAGDLARALSAAPASSPLSPEPGASLAGAAGQAVLALRSHLRFDGGDIVADRETAFVVPAAIRRNVPFPVRTEEELRDLLSAALKRRIVFLRDAPDHHATMFLSPVGTLPPAGEPTVLVGDPVEGARLLSAGLSLPGGPDSSEETAARFEAAADACRAAGYRVVRIPVVPGRDGRTYVTYVNGIIDERDGHRIVYMPTYAPAAGLNRAAARVWESLGYEVRPVDCTALYPHFGTLGCVVNVLRRAADPSV